jgi:hypothetical protein
MFKGLRRAAVKALLSSSSQDFPGTADADYNHAVIMAGIGYVCVQWALLETVAANVIWAFLTMDHETGAIVTGGLDLRPRLSMAIALAEHVKAPPHIKSGIRQIRDTLTKEKLDDRRNQAIHGAHSASDDPSKVNLTMLRWRGDKRTKAVSALELAELGHTIAKLTATLHDLHQEIWRWKGVQTS